MKRLTRLENAGWKVTVYMSGSGMQATKGCSTVVGSSVTDLHRKIFGS